VVITVYRFYGITMGDSQETKHYRKTPTEEVESILAKSNQGENTDAMLASLSPYSLRLWEDMLTEFRKTGDSETLEQLTVADYVNTPPTMREFLEDPYYMGNLMNKSDESEGIFPTWKEILCQDFNYDSTIHNCVVTGSLGIGKCYCAGTYIIMFDGTLKKVEDIVVGDVLMGDDSTPRTVLSTTQGRGEMFDIQPARSESFGCNGDHILVLKSARSEEITEVSVNNFLNWSVENQKDARLYQVGVDWEEKMVPDDPYELGIHLGTRHLCERSGIEINERMTHIPLIYLANSRRIRIELLHGLLVDGGDSEIDDGENEAIFTIKRLADDTRFLAQSLGYHAETSDFTLDDVTYFTTKVYDTKTSAYAKEVADSDLSKTPFEVIPAGVGDYYGFTIDGNHRFLLKDFTVTHNTFVMVTVLLYRVLIATQLRNPHNFFGLTKGTKIIFNLLSVTKAAVADTAFGDAQNFMANSPFFLEECSYNPDSRYTNFSIPLKSSISLSAGSKGQHLLGRNIIGVGLDEGNWRLEADPDNKAYELFNEVRNRINNRFRKVAGFLPAISILASSAKDESSFTETIINEINAANDPACQKVYRNSVYKIKRHTLRLGTKWFKVAYGLKNIPPMILGGWYDEKGRPIENDAHEPEAPGASTELVPDMYFPEFKRRPLNALRDVCGIATGGVNRWFTSMVDFEACVEKAEKEGVVNPVSSGLEMIPMSVEDTKNIWDYLDHPRFLTRVQSQVIPRRHPSALRYAHIDLATTTMAGVSICHLVDRTLVEGVIQNGVPFSEYRLIVEYDFILTIVAGQVKPISLEKIQNFIIWLREKCGYNFGLVTFDQFQSSMSLQMLEARGFKVDGQSLDRTKDGYTNWRSAIEEQRLRPYRHRHMMWEAENLVNTEKKVDHVKDKSKDTTDSCLSLATACVTHNGVARLGALDKGGLYIVLAMTPFGQPMEVKATYLGITRKDSPTLRVRLDNGWAEVTTPDHLFMLRNGEYAEAQHLLPGTELAAVPGKRVKVIGLDAHSNEDVACLRVPFYQNFALASGIFVHNCAGAYMNAINSDEKSMIGVQNNPRIHSTRSLEGMVMEPPLIDIPLPMGYTRVKNFQG
jgi:hypothetical protein